MISSRHRLAGAGLSIVPTLILLLQSCGVSADSSAGAPAGSGVSGSEPEAVASPTAEAGGHEGPELLSSFDPSLKLDRPWEGDLDGMVERRFIRVLVTYSKTH